MKFKLVANNEGLRYATIRWQGQAQTIFSLIDILTSCIILEEVKEEKQIREDII